MVRALVSHQRSCCPASNPGVNAICGLSLLVVLSIATRRFSLVTYLFSIDNLEWALMLVYRVRRCKI